MVCGWERETQKFGISNRLIRAKLALQEDFKNKIIPVFKANLIIFSSYSANLSLMYCTMSEIASSPSSVLADDPSVAAVTKPWKDL